MLRFAKFLDYLTSTEVQSTIYGTFAALSVNKDAQPSGNTQPDSPIPGQFTQYFGAAKGYFVRRPDGTVYQPIVWNQRTERGMGLCAIVDFTNPVSIVNRALLDSGHRAVGLCNVAITFQRNIARSRSREPRTCSVSVPANGGSQGG